MRRMLVAAAAAVALAGCAGQPGDLSAKAQRTLVPLVQDVRDAAAGGSYAQLRSAVATLKRQVRREVSAGQVSDARANAIYDAADQLLVDATPSPTPTPTPSQSSESPTPTATQSSESPSPTPTTTTESPTPTQSASSSPPPSSSGPTTSISIGAVPS